MKKIFFVGEHSNIARELALHLENLKEEYTLVNTFHSPVLGGTRLHQSNGSIGELDLADEQNIHVVLREKPDIIFNASGKVNSYKCYGDELDAFRSNTQTCHVLTKIMAKLPKTALI